MKKKIFLKNRLAVPMYMLLLKKKKKKKPNINNQFPIKEVKK